MVTENLLWKLLTCLMWISMRPYMQISFIIYTIPGKEFVFRE